MTKNFICSAPWQGMFINPDGDFRVCCAGQSLGNLNKKRFLDVINDEPIQKVRNDILTKGYSDYCINCMESEAKQGHSLRNQFLQDLSEFDTTSYNPTITDVRWRNTCQLRCMYCNSEWSSTYASWEGRTTPVSEIEWQSEVLDFLNEHKRHFINVNLLGGEPLLIKENLEFLKMMDSNTRISLVTNLSVKNVEKLPVYQELLKKSCSWLISLEATGKRFEWIRRNAKWDVTKYNYESLPVENKGIHYTYCIYSAFTLVDTFDWLREVHPDSKSNHSHISVLLGPNTFNIYDFTPAIKKAAIKELENCLDKHADYLTNNQTNIILSIKESLTNRLEEVNIQSINSFKEHVRRQDLEMAPIKFSEEWPELSNLLENCDE